MWKYEHFYLRPWMKLDKQIRAHMGQGYKDLSNKGNVCTIFKNAFQFVGFLCDGWSGGIQPSFARVPLNVISL
jgi:hypothetical protein